MICLNFLHYLMQRCVGHICICVFAVQWRTDLCSAGILIRQWIFACTVKDAPTSWRWLTSILASGLKQIVSCAKWISPPNEQLNATYLGGFCKWWYGKWSRQWWQIKLQCAPSSSILFSWLLMVKKNQKNYQFYRNQCTFFQSGFHSSSHPPSAWQNFLRSQIQNQILDFYTQVQTIWWYQNCLGDW